MKTDTLIQMLARGAGPAPKLVALKRFAPVVPLGILVSTAGAFAMLGPIPPAMYETPAPWIKLAYSGLLAVFAGWLAVRLSQPAARLRVPAWSSSVVVLAMLAVGALTLLTAAPHERWAALLGESWVACPWNVLALSIPGLAGGLLAARGLAPTRPRAAGFAAGIFAGSLGAFGYAFACPEVSAAFVAVWYTLGIGLTGLLGAALGPRVLRW